MKTFLLRAGLLLAIGAITQTSNAQIKRALFLGNSYTNYNSLPSLTAELSASAGFELEIASNTPGGYTLEGHSSNINSLALIEQGNWDFVILQEQSQRPSFPYEQVQTEVFPFATTLNELVLSSNQCAETVFYMTWGREEGDAGNCPSWPPVCTYEGMDDLLRERYLEMGEMNDAIVSPVGAVWRCLRENNPEIQLFAADGSHPSAEGSYAAACTFFTVLFRENPNLITSDFNLDESVAATIRNAAETVVFEDFSSWFVGTYDLSAEYEVTPLGGLTFEFTPLDDSGVSHFWDFGNSTSTDINPTITFPAESQYDITHTIFGVCDTVTLTLPFIAEGTTRIKEQEQNSKITVFPNPSNGLLSFQFPIERALIQVFNAEGKRIKELPEFTGSVLNLTDLSSGNYTLVIQELNSVQKYTTNVYIR